MKPRIGAAPAPEPTTITGASPAGSRTAEPASSTNATRGTPSLDAPTGREGTTGDGQGVWPVWEFR
eukprot:4074002-Pyramimonas_sp.AAC.1